MRGIALTIGLLASAAAMAQPPPYVHPLDRPASELGRPTPIVVFAGHETFATGGRNFVRYRIAVANHAAFRPELFAAAPGLPPCGRNMSSARTWVDIYGQSPRGRLHGFCELAGPQDLRQLWFALPAGSQPPATVVVLITDRQSLTYYRSEPLRIPAPPQ
jgi:hypothetical protein